ncbi:MAG: hypothetical protein J6R20_01410 [Clostridia bacterium]|nr:hypothetical protein [Clostridia bacterium]
MKMKSENTAKSGIIFITLLMAIKTVFTQPIYNKLPFLNGQTGLSTFEVLAAVGALILSVMVSVFLIKAAKSIGENATPLVLLAVAEPILITTVSSFFHALAAVITVIWVAFCLGSKNKIASAVVSVVCAAVISFVMPNAIFSYVILGVIVSLISTWGDSKLFGIISAAASAAVSVILVSVIDIETRMNMKISGLFYNFGGNECAPVSFANLTYSQKLSDILSRFSDAVGASLPVIAAVVFVAVTLFAYKADYTDGKKTSDELKKEKVTAVILMTVPYAFSFFASIVCTGISGIMGFNFVPVIIILALALKGNKAVAYAIEKLGEFAKTHPVLSVVALVWLASGTVGFVYASETRLFDYTTQFVM